MLEKRVNHTVRCYVFAGLAFAIPLTINIARQREDTALASTVYVAILDDAREELVNWKPGVAEHRIIMPAFEKSASGWRTIKLFAPQQMQWTIAFDGRNLGQVESRSKAEADQLNSESSRAKQAILTASEKIPSVGKPSAKFAGVFGGGPELFRRPLVAVSKPYFHDPENWKHATLPTSVLRLVQTGFRRQFPKVDRCKDEEIAERDWKFPDSAIKIVRAYASSNGAFLIAVGLDAGDCGWGGHPDDPTDAFVNQWFFVDPDKSVRRIGGFAELLDAGDYDNDGHSELIFFSMRSESSDAYDLVYDGFRQKAELVVCYR